MCVLCLPPTYFSGYLDKRLHGGPDRDQPGPIRGLWDADMRTSLRAQPPIPTAVMRCAAGC